MTWFALLFLGVYAALKSGQYAFIGKASGYRNEPVALAQRLRMGEPALLIIAAVITVPPALSGKWYHKHKFDEMLNKSATCYGLIESYRDAPEVKRSTGKYAIYESYYGYRSTAIDAANQLGFSVREVQQQLDERASSLIAESRQADESLRRSRLSATQLCLRPPSEAPNA